MRLLSFDGKTVLPARFLVGIDRKREGRGTAYVFRPRPLNGNPVAVGRLEPPLKQWPIEGTPGTIPFRIDNAPIRLRPEDATNGVLTDLASHIPDRAAHAGRRAHDTP